MRRLNWFTRAIRQVQLRMVEMQIAMIADYNASLASQQESNDAWLNECRKKEFQLAAELEGVQVAQLDARVYFIQVGDTAFFIPHDADQLRRLMATYREQQAA